MGFAISLVRNEIVACPTIPHCPLPFAHCLTSIYYATHGFTRYKHIAIQIEIAAKLVASRTHEKSYNTFANVRLSFYNGNVVFHLPLSTNDIFKRHQHFSIVNFDPYIRFSIVPTQHARDNGIRHKVTETFEIGNCKFQAIFNHGSVGKNLIQT